MTEDDTFRILKRLSFDELYTLRHSAAINISIITFLEEQGWTYSEYMNALYDRIEKINASLPPRLKV